MSKEKEEKEWHYVDPKADCPHVEKMDFSKYIKKLESEKGFTSKVCEDCGHKESWLCLSCDHVGCSKYASHHAQDHYEKNKDHHIVVSFSDLSFWCRSCNDYIKSPKLQDLYNALVKNKFGKKEKKIDINEYFDSKEDLEKKMDEIVKIIKKSKHTVIYTGAGISTSASIPDYRGPKGVWTLRDKGITPSSHVDIEKCKPTFCHNAISKLVDKGLIKFVVSTNIDGLHLKSGVKKEGIAELHGNIFKEVCSSCGEVYYRDFDTTKSVIHGMDENGGINHYTGRKCDKKSCKGFLKDSIIHFKEGLPSKELKKAIKQSYKSECSIVLGTSLRVQPACSLPFYTKEKEGKVILVNLQKTPYDDDVDIKMYQKTDDFIKTLLKKLDVSI